MKCETWIIVPDIHCPFEDHRFLKIVEHLILSLKPNGGLVQLGDAIDMFQVSKYLKDPTRKNRVYDDITRYKKILHYWAGLLPRGSIIHQLQGNHEARVEKWIWERAPELAEMFVSVPHALGIDGKKIIWHPMNRWDSCKIGNVVCFHGFYFNKHVGVTLLEKYPVCSISGHTHRLQYVSDGTRWAASLGHGSEEKKTAHNPCPTGWQQAIGVLTVCGKESQLEIIKVKNGEAIFRGEKL
jgi:hypothetical protein